MYIMYNYIVDIEFINQLKLGCKEETMLRIKRENTVFEMSATNKAVAHCLSGDTVVFETHDCFGNQIKNESQLMDNLDFDRINPATGPLFVDGAEPGDVIKVEIKGISINSYGIMCQAPNVGVTGALIQSEVTKIVPVRDGIFALNDKLSFPVDPMIGVIGTAPKGEGINTGTPDCHGGNMDCNKIREGSVLYLPVNVEGGLLAMGDLHAAMGNGEVCVCGVEIKGEVTVRVTLLKNCKIPTPFLTDATHFMTIYSAENLDKATEGATLSMQKFLADEVGMAIDEAGFLLSAVGNVEICQCVDPNKTVRMEVPNIVLDSYEVKLP